MGFQDVQENNVDKGFLIFIDRWHNHLAPEINKKPWSEKEEEVLF